MNSITKATKFIEKYFFNKNTCLIYDFKTNKYRNAWFHLPKPHDINNDYPNPCGWGTGMEDSVLNTGTAMDALVADYNVTENKNLKQIADKLFKGLMLCANCGKSKGFIARAVSPEDAISHYTDTSRDQYTHWVYAAVRFYDSPLCDEQQKEDIRRVLVALAERCEQNVTEENDYNILRDDGKKSLVGKMYGEVYPHEYLRLPMFYLAAYHVSNDEHWKELCNEICDEALEKTKPHNPELGRGYITLQLQYSLRMMYDLSVDKKFKEEVISLMQAYADYCEKIAIDKGVNMINNVDKKEWNFHYKAWNKVENMYDGGVFEEKRYLNPNQSEFEENKAFYPIREVGEYASVAALCPKKRINEEVLEVLEKLANKIDYKNHYTYAPLLLVSGYKLCIENLKYN